MKYALAKDLTEQTKLWRIVRAMPKGALLHAHCSATIDFDNLFPVLLETPGMHILGSASHLATSEARESAPFWIGYKATAQATSDIWSEDYDVGAPVLLVHAADTFPNGGRNGFNQWLRSRVTVTLEEATEQKHGIDHIWRKFGLSFTTLSMLIQYEPIWRAFLRQLMSAMAKDNVRWLELRSGPFAIRRRVLNAVSKELVDHFINISFYKEGSETPEESLDPLFVALDEEIQKFKATDSGKNFWGLRMIWTSMRGLPTEQLLDDMNKCIAIKLKFPHLIAGYDVAGPEDLGRPLKDLIPELVWFREQCNVNDVDIPFFFHAGETLSTGGETDRNLFDAILMGTRRIGHGFSLYKHPTLIDMVRDKAILIESCPISNEVLRYCSSILSHPLPALLARGIACALSNDDPTILDSVGLSSDFWQALQGWESLGLAGLGSLAESSIRWAAFTDQNDEDWQSDVKSGQLGNGLKAQKLREWKADWERFCQWIVDEFEEADK